MGLEEVEMLHFPKEMSVICRNHVDEIAQFVCSHRTAQKCDVFREFVHLEESEPLGQAGCHQDLLVVAQIDPAVFVDELANELVVLI